jgi:hypothetical protein
LEQKSLEEANTFRLRILTDIGQLLERQRSSSSSDENGKIRGIVMF